MSAVLRVRAPAKVNLRLEVLAREDSGYHQLETLFCALELADELELAGTTASIELAVQGADLGPTEDNLAYRAALAFFAASGIRAGVSMRLKKHIPAGAGLGGGSSDAASTLLALDRMHREPLGAQRLLELGQELGSDVPFFLCGSSLALAWGRGGRVFPLEPLHPLSVLLLVPPFQVSTAQAYAELAAARRQGVHAAPRVLRAARLADWEDIARHARNDFEPVVFGSWPQLAEARALLLREGALLALLAGSGGVVFGVFREPGRLAAAASACAAQLPAFQAVVTRTAGPAILPYLV